MAKRRSKFARLAANGFPGVRAVNGARTRDATGLHRMAKGETIVSPKAERVRCAAAVEEFRTLTGIKGRPRQTMGYHRCPFEGRIDGLCGTHDTCRALAKLHGPHRIDGTPRLVLWADVHESRRKAHFEDRKWQKIGG